MHSLESSTPAQICAKTFSSTMPVSWMIFFADLIFKH